VEILNAYIFWHPHPPPPQYRGDVMQPTADTNGFLLPSKLIITINYLLAIGIQPTCHYKHLLLVIKHLMLLPPSAAAVIKNHHLCCHHHLMLLPPSSKIIISVIAAINASPLSKSLIF
jgi:hypothetical protein